MQPAMPTYSTDVQMSDGDEDVDEDVQMTEDDEDVEMT